MAHVSEEKKKVVANLLNLLKEYPIVAAVNMENLPAPQLQMMREKLREKVALIMTKRRLMKIALEQVKADKKGIEELIPHLKGMPALLFTKDNPFALFKTIMKNKSSAPAKAGQVAPRDIVVNAGPTSFAPGPIIGELGAAKIKAGIDGGKVVIKEDSVVVKEGEVIPENLAGILTRLEIKPMEVGLDITAIYEDGSIFLRDILEIDEDEFKNNITQAHSWAFNLAMEAGILTEETTEIMIQKAFNDSKALALEQNILADAVAEDLLAKAEAQMIGLKSQLNIEVVESKAEDKKEEIVEEETVEKKEEEKPVAEETVEKKEEEKSVAEETVEKKEEEKPVEEKTEGTEDKPESPEKEE